MVEEGKEGKRKKGEEREGKRRGEEGGELNNVATKL